MLKGRLQTVETAQTMQTVETAQTMQTVETALCPLENFECDTSRDTGSFMTYHAIDFDRYLIFKVLYIYFQSEKKNYVFSLMKLYFTPRWTLNDR